MHIASPIFLFALLPWVALVLWLLLGKRRRVNVSFLELWKGPVTGPTARRRIGMPPIALTAVLAALLLSILAAARPGIRGSNTDQKPIVIVVDRGLSMSMGKPPRFTALLEEAKQRIRHQFGEGEVQIVLVPQGEVNGAAGTAIDTRGMVDVAVRQQSEMNPASPVIVVTDQDVKFDDKRVVKIGPSARVQNISIAHVAARISPLGQVQVRLRNQSEQKRAVLRVLSDGRENAGQEVELPAMGQTRDYFLPIDPAAKVIRVELDVMDDFAGDNLAFLVKRGSWPILEARTPVFAELARLIEKYSKLRQGGEESRRVAIVSAPEAGSGPQIILGKVGMPATGEVIVADHPITKALEKLSWKMLADDPVAEPIGDGWKPILRVGEKTAIAVREAPARQVWMGISTQKLASSTEFVILWSNIFEWVGQGGEEFAARTTGDLENGWMPTRDLPAGLKPGWWPGIYRRADGAILAVNAPDVVIAQNAASDWNTRLVELAKQHRQTNGVRGLTTPLILGAMALMLLAAITWRGGLKKAKEKGAFARQGLEARATV